MKISGSFRQRDPKPSARKSCNVSSELSDSNKSALKGDFVKCQVQEKVQLALRVTYKIYIHGKQDFFNYMTASGVSHF